MRWYPYAIPDLFFKKPYPFFSLIYDSDNSCRYVKILVSQYGLLAYSVDSSSPDNSLFFRSSEKKISTFLILICILAVSENIAATFALPIYTLIHHEESFRYNLLYTSGEMLFLIIIDFFVALLFIKKLVPLIRNYSHSIQLTTIAELLFPVQASSFLVGILLYRKNSPWLKWLIILYWFLNLLCCLIIARAFHNISLREKRHELLVQQMSFLQKQLEYTTEMEQEYQSVRKWNHDMENHLFSLNYLIRTQKYLEADVYLETILSELPPEKRTL